MQKKIQKLLQAVEAVEKEIDEPNCRISNATKYKLLASSSLTAISVIFCIGFQVKVIKSWRKVGLFGADRVPYQKYLWASVLSSGIFLTTNLWITEQAYQQILQNDQKTKSP